MKPFEPQQRRLEKCLSCFVPGLASVRLIGIRKARPKNYFLQ